MLRGSRTIPLSRRTTRSRRAATAGKEHTITVTTDATRPPFDELLVEIAQYALGGAVDDDEALDTAVLCLMDALGCAMAALAQPACTRVLGPIVPGADAVGGVPVPGTSYCLDPVKAAFDIGSMVRWLDFNDTWLAAEWGHPSDNLGAILACALHRGSRPGDAGPPTTMRDVLFAMIRAYEIQGVLALNTAFNRLGLDHVILVRIASSAVATALLGGSREQVQNALSNGFLDGGALRAYRHAPNTGSRKSWAAGDATARGVQHALMALRGEMGYPAALSAPTWGFHDVVLGGQALALARPLGSYVMRNILFKVAYPAEFHAQTAAEAAVTLHAQVRDRLEDIERIEIETQESAMRIIDKTGPLHNPADRDHCLQYIVAVALIHGRLEAGHYEDGNASDPRIDRLRERMRLQEAPSFSRDYMDAEKRSIANALQIFFKDGSSTPRVEVPYPLGHRRRRREALPLLKAKFERNAAGLLDRDRLGEIMALFEDRGRMETMKVGSFMELFGCG